MRQINCYIPIKVCITGSLSDAQLEELSSTLAGTLIARLDSAERTILSDGNGHLHGRETGILRADYDPSREDVASIYKIPSYGGPGETKSIPIRRTGPPWFIRRAIEFKAYANQFLDVVESWGPFPGKDVYSELEGELRWVSAWLVQVNREYMFTEIMNVLWQRARELSKVQASQSLISVVANDERLRQQLIEIDQSNVVAREIPVIKRSSALFRRESDGTRVMPGARLLHASMVVPKIELKDRAELGGGIQITVRLKDLTFLVNPIATFDRFKQKHALSWDTYLQEFGDKPERVHVHPVTVRKRTERSVLKLLVEDALKEQIYAQMGDQSRLWGELYLLNNTTLATFPPLVRNQASGMTNDLTRPVDQSKTYNAFEPNWKAAYVFTILTTSSKSIYVAGYRPRAAADATRLMAYLDERLVTVSERWGFMDYVKKNLYGFHPAYFEVLLDELKSRDGGKWFDRFFARVKEAKDYDLRMDVIRNVKDTKYAKDPSVLDLIRHHNKIERERSSGNVYDVKNQRIILNKFFGDKPVSSGEILYEVWDSYKHDETRYRPNKEFETLRPDIEQKKLELMGRISRGEDPVANDVGYTDEEFALAVLQEVFKSKGISEKDMAKYFDAFTIRLSVRFLSLSLSTDDAGIESVTVNYQVVEKEGDGEWVPVGEIQRASDSNFDYYIERWVHERVSSAIITISHIALAIAAIAVAWEFGVLGPLFRLGGGARVVIPSIIISTIYEVIVHGFTFESFLFGAINGYLGAVFFRGAGGAARLFFGRSITTITFRQGVMKWIGVQVFKGTIGGSSSAAAMRFAQDAYLVGTGRGDWSSPGDYAKTIGYGAALGIGFELAGPLILEPVVGRVFSGAKEVAELLAKNKVNPFRWQAWAAQANATIRKKTAELLERQPGKALTISNGIKLLYEGVGEAFTGLGRGLRVRLQLSVFRQLLEFSGADLSGLGVKGLEKFLTSSATHLSEAEALKIVKRLLAPGAAHPNDFFENINLLEQNAVGRLMTSGELDGWLLIFEEHLILSDGVRKGLGHLYQAEGRSAANDFLRLAPKKSLSKMLNLLGGLKQSTVEELAQEGYLLPLAEAPHVLDFLPQPEALDLLRRMVRNTAGGKGAASAVETVVASIEGQLKTNPKMTVAEVEAANPPRRPTRDKTAGGPQRETVSSKKKSTTSKGGGAKGDTAEPTIDPEPRSPVEQAYDRAQDTKLDAENEVLILTDRIRNLKTSPSGRGQLIAELEDALVGAKQTLSIVGPAADAAEKALLDSSLPHHKKLSAAARRRKVFTDKARLVGNRDQVGEFDIDPKKDWIEIDHLVAIRRITTEQRFRKILLLAWEDQIEIVNFVGVDGTNLWGMTGRFNASKSDLPWREWPQASQYYDSPPRGITTKMKAEEIKLERLIENEINKRYDAMLARRASKKP